MPVLETLKILENRQVCPDCFQMRLESEHPLHLKCGQFLNVKIDGFPLRRPISVSEFDDYHAILVYKTVGAGTKALAAKKEGTVEALCACGNGFDLSGFGNEVLAVGGGLGAAPLLAVIKEAKAQGKNVKVIFGFRNREEALFEETLKKLDVDYVYAFDEDGENPVMKMQEKGWDQIPFVSCGPLIMMENLCRASKAVGQVSLETRMGCGFGACMGCSLETVNGMKRICKEGPVFESTEVIWENLK